MMRALLIDGGQSGCRAAVIDHGRTVATTTLPGLPRQGRDYAVLSPLLAGRTGEFDGGEADRRAARGADGADRGGTDSRAVRGAGGAHASEAGRGAGEADVATWRDAVAGG